MGSLNAVHRAVAHTIQMPAWLRHESENKNALETEKVARAHEYWGG